MSLGALDVVFAKADSAGMFGLRFAQMFDIFRVFHCVEASRDGLGIHMFTSANNARRQRTRDS